MITEHIRTPETYITWVGVGASSEPTVDFASLLYLSTAVSDDGGGGFL